MATKLHPIYLENFAAGIFTNRSPLTVPKDANGNPHIETLIDGQNVEVSPRNTLVRRPGFPTWNNTAFASSEWPLAYWSGRLNGTLYDLVDTQVGIYTVTPSALTLIYTKATTSKSYFQQSGNLLYFADGTTNKKWDGTTVTNAGVAAPLAAPSIANLNLHDTVGATQTVHAWSPNYAYVGPTTGTNTLWLKDPNGNYQFAFVQANQTAVSGNSSPTWSTVVGNRTVDGNLTWTNAGPSGAWIAATAFSSNGFAPGNIQNLFSGPSIPTAYAQSGSGATWSGTLPGQLTALVPNGTSSKNLDLTGYGSALPSGATVTGVRVDVSRNASTNRNTYFDTTVELLKAGTPAGSNKAVGGFWPTGQTTQSYGSANDLWGTTISQSDANNSGFGVRLVVSTDDTHTVIILSVKITIFYSVTTLTGTFTSSIVLDSNGNLQRVKTSGTTGGSAPAWSTTIGGTTTDNTVTWECLGSGNTLAAFVGWKYAASYHTPVPHTSTLGPALSLSAPIVGLNVTLTGLGSADTQVDRNDLYRTTDGGALFFFDASANNVDGSTSWTIVDSLQDVQLNATLVGPIADANDPPPAGMTDLTSYMGRLWGVVGNLLYFTAGPDCTNGNKDESWPPANVFPMPSSLVDLAPSSNGLVVTLSDGTWAILGGPQTLTFFPQPILQNIGVLNSDCVAQDGDTIFMYTSTRQLIQLTFSGKSEIGFAVADTLSANFDPSISSLTIHRNGPDEGLFISNGVDSVQRYSLNGLAWSARGIVTGGVGLIRSLETASGTYTLIAGRPTGSGLLLARSLTSHVDGSSTYSAYATIGSIVLSPPGANGLSVKSIALQYLTLGTDLLVSVLPNEVSGSFTSIPFTATDPWQLPAASTVSDRRHDWLGVASPLPNILKHVQIKVTFASEDVANELLSVGVIPNV